MSLEKRACLSIESTLAPGYCGDEELGDVAGRARVLGKAKPGRRSKEALDALTAAHPGAARTHGTPGVAWSSPEA
jgi:hypothetical protein